MLRLKQSKRMHILEISKNAAECVYTPPFGGKKRPAYFVPPKKSFGSRATAGSFDRASEMGAGSVLVGNTFCIGWALGQHILHWVVTWATHGPNGTVMLVKCPLSDLVYCLTLSKLPAVARFTKDFWGDKISRPFFPPNGGV